MSDRKILADVTNKNIFRFTGLLEIADDDSNRALLQRMLMDEVERFTESHERSVSLENNLGDVAVKLERHLKLIAYVPVGSAGRAEEERLICNLTMAYGALAFIHRSNTGH